MTTNYTITAGTHPNSVEVYFDSNPALEIIKQYIENQEVYKRSK